MHKYDIGDILESKSGEVKIKILKICDNLTYDFVVLECSYNPINIGKTSNNFMTIIDHIYTLDLTLKLKYLIKDMENTNVH
jgi:hypothetical protein